MKTNIECPCCKEKLESLIGDQLHPGSDKHGVTVYCSNRGCGMADWGHGKNEKEACEVFFDKCSSSKKRGK